MRSPDSIHVATITRAAWDRVCHTRACSGRQMALYRSKAMATRLRVDTLTDTPKQEKNKGNLGKLHYTITTVTSPTFTRKHPNLARTVEEERAKGTGWWSHLPMR